MSDLSKWLVEQETRFLPFFPTAGCLGAKEHVIALLILHAATCHEHFDKGPFFIEGLLGMYRVNGNSPFSLPVDGWGKIRRAQQQGMADELRIDICDRAYLADLVRPIPDETLVESLRELVKAAPVVDSLAASDAIAVWRGEGDIGQTEVPPLDESGVENLRIATRNADRGRSALAAFWAILHLGYKDGFAAKVQEPKVSLIFGREPWDALTGQLNAPEAANVPAVWAMVMGFVFVFGLMSLKMNCVWWPIHPIGYAVSGSWSMMHLWCPFVIAWSVKWTITRYGGHEAFRRAVPYALGMILGDLVGGSLWTIYGILKHVPTYSIWV